MEKRKQKAERRVQPKHELLTGARAADIETGQITAPEDDNIGAAE